MWVVKPDNFFFLFLCEKTKKKQNMTATGNLLPQNCVVAGSVPVCVAVVDRKA